YHTLYADGIIIRNLRHHFFTQGFPPAPPGASQLHTFGSTIDAEISMDGGMTFEQVSAPAQVGVQIVDTTGGSNTLARSYDTEMLQLDISGGTLPPGVMLRESPTLPSKGQTTVRPIAGGYMIGSFFD